MEIKTCEEYVLGRIEDLEKELAMVKEAKAKNEEVLKYADGVINVLRQFIVMREVDEKDGGGYFVGGSVRLDPKEHGEVIKMLGGLFLEKKKNGEDKKEATHGDLDGDGAAGAEVSKK